MAAALERSARARASRSGRGRARASRAGTSMCRPSKASATRCSSPATCRCWRRAAGKVTLRVQQDWSTLLRESLPGIEVLGDRGTPAVIPIANARC